MQALAASIGDYFRALPLTELVAVVMALAYLILAIRQNIWCWFCAAVSTAIYVYLFVLARLYMESLLNVFYFGMAVYGWCVWRSGTTDVADLPVSVWKWQIHAIALLGITVSVAISGFLLAKYSDAVYPYVDSATTFTAVWATFLVARKVLENWWYWLAIDAASVVIYWSRELEVTAVLFVLYLLLIPIGLVSWTRSYRTQTLPAPVA